MTEVPFPVYMSDNGNYSRERIVATGVQQGPNKVLITIPENSPLYKFLQAGELINMRISADVKIGEDDASQKLSDEAYFELQEICSKLPEGKKRLGVTGV